MKYPILTVTAFCILVGSCRKKEECTYMVGGIPPYFNFVLFDQHGKSVIDDASEISIWYGEERLRWQVNHSGRTLAVPYDFMVSARDIFFLSSKHVNTYYLHTKTPDGVVDVDTLYVDGGWESRPCPYPAVHRYKQVTFNGKPVTEGTDSESAGFFVFRKTSPPPVVNEYELADKK